MNKSAVTRYLALMKIIPKNQIERQQCEQLYLQFSSEVHERLHKAVSKSLAGLGLPEIPSKLGANIKMILARTLRKLLNACLSGKMSFLTASNLIAQGQIYQSVVHELDRVVYGEVGNGHFAGLLLSLESSAKPAMAMVS